MNNILFLLSLKPILYGFIGMLISGLCFPIAGVIILRNNLIPMRYMLMHGVILGGVISIALGIPLLPVVIFLNIILILIMHFMNFANKTKLATVSTSMMVLTMGLASLFSHVFNVPSKDMLELLWGSPFALTKANLIVLIVLGILLVLYILFCFKPISILFFDEDIAKASGVNVSFHKLIMLMILAVVISVAMKMVGALLIDALVILPVVAISQNAKSLKGLFFISSLTGFLLSFTSYMCALVFNLPVSGIMAVLSVVVFVGANIIKIFYRRIYEKQN